MTSRSSFHEQKDRNSCGTSEPKSGESSGRNLTGIYNLGRGCSYCWCTCPEHTTINCCGDEQQGGSRNTTTDQGEDETELLDEALNFDGLLLCKYCWWQNCTSNTTTNRQIQSRGNQTGGRAILRAKGYKTTTISQTESDRIVHNILSCL